MDDADRLRESSALYWQLNQRQRRFARFVTAEPIWPQSGPSEPISECASRLRDALIQLDVSAAFGAYTEHPHPHLHCVIWPTRKWRHAHIRDVLASVGLQSCGNPRLAVQKVDLLAQDDNAKLWSYIAKHVSRDTGTAFSLT